MQNPFEWQIPFELQGVSIPVQSCLSTICEFVIVIKNVVRRRPKNRFRFRFLNIIILFYKFELKVKNNQSNGLKLFKTRDWGDRHPA